MTDIDPRFEMLYAKTIARLQAENERQRDEIERLRDALRSVIEAWNNEYAGEMAIDRAILVERLEEASREARELLHGPLSEALKKTK